MASRWLAFSLFVFGGDQAKWSALATLCPADKKVIHGMKDGIDALPG